MDSLNIPDPLIGDDDTPPSPPLGPLPLTAPTWMATLQAALNFKSVVRTDPSASQVLLTSSHAVLYVFKESRWERAEIEGTLLLYSRAQPADPWAFIILNRLHANNYRQLCGEIDSFQREDDLLIYRTKTGTPPHHHPCNIPHIHSRRFHLWTLALLGGGQGGPL